MAISTKDENTMNTISKQSQMLVDSQFKVERKNKYQKTQKEVPSLFQCNSYGKVCYIYFVVKPNSSRELISKEFFSSLCFVETLSIVVRLFENLIDSIVMLNF